MDQYTSVAFPVSIYLSKLSFILHGYVGMIIR